MLKITLNIFTIGFVKPQRFINLVIERRILNMLTSRYIFK